MPGVTCGAIRGDFRAGAGLGTGSGGRPLDGQDAGDCAELCRGDGDAGKRPGNGLDWKGQRDMDRGAEGARAVAVVYGCGYGS